MKRMAELASSALRSKSGKKAENSPQPDISTVTEAQMFTLWTRMAEIYGHRWTSTYGSFRIDDRMSATAQTWRKGLDGLGAEDIARGLRACLSTGETWPPSLPSFYGMCRRYATAAHRPHKRLPPPEPTPEVAEDAIAKMKQAVRREAS